MPPVVSPAEIERAETWRDSVLKVLGLERSLEAITNGDRGISAVFFRASISRLMKKDEDLNLMNFRQYNLQATQLAEKIAKGRAWIVEATAKLADHRITYTDAERAELQRKVEDRSQLVAAWGQELEMLEGKQAEAIRLYLEAQPNHKLTVNRKGTGEIVVFSARPIPNSPYPVWTPRHIASAARVMYAMGCLGGEAGIRTFGEIGHDYSLDPLQFIADHCDIDPLLAVKLTDKEKQDLRDAARAKRGKGQGLLSGTGAADDQEGKGFGKL